jgi:hypothetical protein
MPHATLDAAANKLVTPEPQTIEIRKVQGSDLTMAQRSRVTSFGHGCPRNQFYSMKDYGRQAGNAGKPDVNKQSHRGYSRD